MNQNYIKLYSESSEPDSSYLLSEGNVYLYVSDMDKYVVKGRNLIIGGTEIIMSHFLNTDANRIETAIIDKNSKIKRMPVEKFIMGMKTFSFALNVSMVIAKQVLLTNNIINKNINELAGDTNRTKELLIEYYTIINRLKEEYQKRKLPWINEIVAKYETSLTFKKGEAFYKSSEPTVVKSIHDLSDNMIEYPRGSILCEENTSGEEMYILQSGTIDVIVNKNKVATIDEPGTVFGEMALLLNEKRTATLTAKNNVVISKITKENLKKFSQKQSGLLLDICSSLAKKHYYNVIKIKNTNQSLVEKAFDNENSPKNLVSDFDKTKKDLRLLKNSIEEISSKKDAEFLQDLISGF